ncbi:hypothetical protein DAEQUDRAFT_729895 [Daedalea quercina L-15889]|uniref:DUF6533 domain-containing protein n=1 Tax=Daedalea quercina L-15889 TaxID=1314783 RepID=A0A165NBH6_9APHY|nr:hypothetical protein DAEQUDRAFT_729895 [Daedalea quercina L-15889]
MSGPIAEATYILQIAVVENYLCIAAAALLIYEEVITLGDEVAHIRSPRKLGWLFLLNRLNTFALTASLILAGQTSYDSSR